MITEVYGLDHGLDILAGLLTADSYAHVEWIYNYPERYTGSVTRFEGEDYTVSIVVIAHGVMLEDWQLKIMLRTY